MKQQRRAEVLVRVGDGLSTADAASFLGLSDRQVRRLKDAFMHSGFSGLVHGNTGRPSSNRTASKVEEEILALCGPEGPYHKYNVCHARDVLLVNNNVTIGRSTLDRLLRDNGLIGRRHRRQITKRCRRERSTAEGLMIQIDGSPHAWLEDRAPIACLMGAIDDATGKVVHARFHKTEDQKGYLILLREVCTNYGVPMKVYHDKHTILRSPKEQTIEDELMGTKPMSQVQRVMNELGAEAIAANSPQAKGRVERLWRTLQDRLVKEMTLAQVNTLEEANAFLPAYIERHNLMFATQPRDPNPAWVQLDENADLERLFSTREVRKVANDHTISLAGRTLLIQREKPDRSLAGKRIAVHVTPEGHTHIYQNKTRLNYSICSQLRKPEAATPIPTVPDAVRLALEHRSQMYRPHTKHIQQTPPARATATPPPNGHYR